MDMISAICLTHSSRFGLLQRAVLNFLEQTYAERELLIVSGEQGYTDAIRAFLRDPRVAEIAPNVKQVPIRLFTHRFRQPIEAVLHAGTWAKGQWLACWDDDDLSHPTRLEVQLSRTDPGSASMLGESLYYFYDSHELFATRYAQPSGRMADRCAASSLLVHRECFPSLDLMMREAWAPYTVDRVAASQRFDLIDGRPELFLVCSNGDNFRGSGHHRHLGSGLPGTWTREQLIARTADVEAWVKSYRFDRSEVDVCGKDAQAFTVEGVQVWPAWLTSTNPPADWHAGIPNRQLQERIQQERTAARQGGA